MSTGGISCLEGGALGVEEGIVLGTSVYFDGEVGGVLGIEDGIMLGTLLFVGGEVGSVLGREEGIMLVGGRVQAP